MGIAGPCWPGPRFKCISLNTVTRRLYPSEMWICLVVTQSLQPLRPKVMTSEVTGMVEGDTTMAVQTTEEDGEMTIAEEIVEVKIMLVVGGDTLMTEVGTRVAQEVIVMTQAGEIIVASAVEVAIAGTASMTHGAKSKS